MNKTNTRNLIRTFQMALVLVLHQVKCQLEVDQRDSFDWILYSFLPPALVTHIFYPHFDSSDDCHILQGVEIDEGETIRTPELQIAIIQTVNYEEDDGYSSFW